ncbi:UNVERIFIED_CONTAM: Germin-like protein 12-2 [Sesamum angustifolium]|uniref:Germin-like protein n=1 Tax=Sesamum angustifolium TaxID=2727405 RepID=A0AAW2KXQ2_9LAMI
MPRIHFAPSGVNPPHTHPRATEILTKLLQKGDVFVFPVNLIHFQRNTGYGNAVAIAALSSQNPGVITISNAVFGSNSAIANDLLANSFQADTKTIDWIKSKF